MDKSKVSAKKVFKIILDVLVWIFVVFAVVVTMLTFAALSNQDGVPSIGGRCILTVSSNSMHPTFDEGDIIIGHRLDDADIAALKVGDIITYRVSFDDKTSVLNTHRIVEVTDLNGEVAFYTQGDNKETNATRDDNVIPTGALVAQYREDKDLRIPGLGKVLSFLQKPTGFLVCIVLPLVLFFLYEMFMFIKKYIEVKNSGKKQITAADEELIRQQAVAEYLRQQEAAKAAASEPSEQPAAESTEETNVTQ